MSTGGRRQPDQVILRGTRFHFRYSLGTGHWTLTGSPDTRGWTCAATARVDLITPSGQLQQRAATSAVLVSCQEEPRETEGQRSLIVWRAWPDGLRIAQRFVLWLDAQEFLAEVVVRPPPGFGLALQALVPIAPPIEGEGNLRLAPSSSDWQVLDIGWAADEPVRVTPLASTDLVVATGLAALGAADDGAPLTVGFLDASQAVGSYRFARVPSAPETETTGLSVLFEASASFGTVQLPTAGLTSGSLWLTARPVGPALLRFADLWRTSNPMAPTNATIAQWTPHVALDHARPSGRQVQESILDQLAAAARWRGIGVIDVVAIQDTLEAANGSAAPPHPPHREAGMLADAIHSQGLRAGLVLEPFLVSPESSLVRDHPTWLVRTPSGDPTAVEADSTHPGPDRFALDLSQLEVLSWLRRAGERAVESDFSLVQLDRLAESVVSGWRADPLASPIASFRRGLAVLREVFGQRSLIAAAAPLFASLDFVDAVQTSATPLVRADPTPLLRSFLGETGRLVGAGPLCLDAEGQSLEEARAAATVAGLAGGIVSVGCAIGNLPNERGQILRACLPPYRGPIYPLDPFAPKGPRLFALPVQVTWGSWLLVVALNPSNDPMALVTSLPSLGLAEGRYEAFEFWSQRYLGVLTDRLTIDHIAPGGCVVVGLRAERDEPQVVGTSLHVSLGAVALRSAGFRRANRSLQCAVGRPGNWQGTISVVMPPGWEPGPVRGTGGTFTVRRMTERLASIDVQFRDVADFELDFWHE